MPVRHGLTAFLVLLRIHRAAVGNLGLVLSLCSFLVARVLFALGEEMDRGDLAMRQAAVFFCDLTGVMGAPWAEAGYDIVLVDPQHGATSIETLPNGARVYRFAGTISDSLPFISRLLRTHKIIFAFGFPPCTDVAVSGARHFDAKRQKDPHFQAKAALVAEQCRTAFELFGCPWGFENPVSVFSSIFGRPDYIFHPHWFTGHCADDNYTKTTCIWAGGGFVMPDPFVDESLGPPDDRIHKAPPGAGRANFRSATPRGFSRAAFESNVPKKAMQLALQLSA